MSAYIGKLDRALRAEFDRQRPDGINTFGPTVLDTGALVRALLAALQEPSEEMHAAGREIYGGAIFVWQAMLEAAQREAG